MPNTFRGGSIRHTHGGTAYHWTACERCNVPICHLCAFGHGANGHGGAESFLADLLGV